MAEKKEKVLSVQDLVIDFKTDNGILKAVRGVSFDLYQGETLCIVGESGSGKSVTSKAIMGILANNAIIAGGSIIYRGENLLEVSEDEFYKIRGHRIGMIFQDPLSSLNPIVKIGKQITEAMLINSDKLKTMYNDLISDDLIRYKNTLAKMNIAITNEKKKLEAFISETEAKENRSKEQKSQDKALIRKKQQEFREFEKKTRDKYMDEAKGYKAILTETEKRAKKEVAAYKEKVTGEFKEKERELKQKIAAASDKEEKDRLDQELLREKEDFTNKLRITKAEAKRRALKIMHEVGIPEPEKRYNQYPFEFSGGMRQRIVIAIALTASPEILICDEPTTALDVTIQAQILELINKIKAERNLSCIFITHDLGVVANMADRVAVMYAGKIVEYGLLDEVFYDPRHPYTWALLASIPDVDSKEKLESIPGTPPDMIYPPVGDAFAQRNKYAMNIDFREQPPFFKISDTHSAATWLLHPNAPKVEMPKIVSERIKNSLEEKKR
ncbi:MAG: ATP-binding cassette domain-containing protein [Clostridia bacterium]|nr:ATP-binding cassette domain-containing protein [Clostridia bacterium]MBR4359988.1 ATP-binding cassette domain-containing protein [Clostridia bacterium]